MALWSAVGRQRGPRQATRLCCLGAIIVPGLIDWHVHYPQLDVIASPAADLLDWLNNYTFPAEAAFADPAHAHREAVVFLDAMLAAGTTSALVFATAHSHAVEALFRAAERRHLRLTRRATMTDHNAPKELLGEPSRAYLESTELIRKWHGCGRLNYAVTPRFAPPPPPPPTADLLAVAGRLLAKRPGELLHTHLSEAKAEIASTRELFPAAADYVDVYRQHGLVGGQAVFAGHSLSLVRVMEEGNKVARRLPYGRAGLASKILI